MLKKRIIASIFIRDGIAVQSVGFKKYLPIGRPEISASAFNSWGADEILLVDISASLENRLISIDIVTRVAAECSVPLTVGGGIKSIKEIELLMDAGADKVLLNTANLDINSCLEIGRKIYGRQCMVAGLDYIKHKNNFYVYDHRSGNKTNTLLIDAVKHYIRNGAGELFVNDVLRDGKEIGYDLDAIKLVTSASIVPVIWCGGAGKPQHFLNAFKATKVNALSAGNIFHFAEHSINIIKSFVSKEVSIRQDTQFNYNAIPLDNNGRVLKQGENLLDQLLYKKLKVEVI